MFSIVLMSVGDLLFSLPPAQLSPPLPHLPLAFTVSQNSHHPDKSLHHLAYPLDLIPYSGQHVVGLWWVLAQCQLVH